MQFTGIRKISAEETRLLRQKILRPHQTVESLAFPGDDDPTTAHIGYFSEGMLVGTVTIYPKAAPNENDSVGWQLRGMAVDKGLQGKGYGKALVLACLDHVKNSGGQY